VDDICDNAASLTIFAGPPPDVDDDTGIAALAT
jgi:hypothetical protein